MWTSIRILPSRYRSSSVRMQSSWYVPFLTRCRIVATGQGGINDDLLLLSLLPLLLDHAFHVLQ